MPRGLIGAGTGAIIGNQSGDAAKGALLGGALGAGTGAFLGDKKDKKNQEQEKRYQNARY